MLELREVSKRFGAVQAVCGVSLSVGVGEVVGFLGANGAGKSTTLRMMAGYLRPDSGCVLVGGHDTVSDGVSARRLTGYLPENAPVYGEMTVRSFLEYCAGLRGVARGGRGAEVARVASLTSLEPVLERRVGTLSKGYVHRVCLSQALLGSPRLLLLDEPTDGLDPVQKREVQSLIAELGRRCAIVVSSHILSEVESMCTRVVLIAGGRLRLDALVSEVRGHLGELFEVRSEELGGR